MCQLNSLRDLFKVWNANPSLGLRQLNKDANPISLRALAKDSDCDGLPDTLEARLLEKFRPYFKFSKLAGNDDNNRPADARWYARNCEVVMVQTGGSKTIFSNEVFKDKPENVLTLSLAGSDSAAFPTDILENARRTNTHLTVPDDMRGTVWQGAPWDEILQQGNVGLYGHVVPIYLTGEQRLPKEYNWGEDKYKFADRTLYKIEYWLFCPLNNDNFGGALNHEADWMTVQLIYDPLFAHIPANHIPLSFFADNDTLLPSQHIYSVQHWAHGTNRELVVDDATQVFDHTTDSGTKFIGLDSGDAKTMFLQDPDQGAWSHPVVYIEYGSHEFWPTSSGFVGAPNHNGDSFCFLTSTPPNIGEVEHPVTTETAAAELILRFNGFWGLFNLTNDPPPGPILHYAWSWMPVTDKTDPNYKQNKTRLEIARQQAITGGKYFE